MSFPKYSKYKDSGVVWLGEVPEHWDYWKVSHSFLAIGSGTTPNSDSNEWYDGTIPWVTTGELRENVIDDTFKKVTEYALKKFSALRIHPAGSLAIAMYGATIGRLGILGIDATTNQACCVLSNPTSITTRFMFYWFLGHKEHIIALYATGGGQPNINQDIVRGFRVPVPSIEDQNVISSFLDRETAKIDALVAEQEKLIELLKEKRQAVISHAVTKGLDPNVPMKNSGVEWLGEVPEHWGLVPLKWFSRCASGENTSSILVEPEDNGELFPIIGGNGVMGYGPSSNINKTVIIIGRVGALCGNIHLIKEKAWITDNALILDASSTMFDHEFLTFLLKARNLNEIASKTAQPLITGTQVRDQRIPTPPIDEQVKIVDYLKHQLSTFDSLIQESQRAIDLLKERRAALISAAVTGKIDVRGLTEAML